MVHFAYAIAWTYGIWNRSDGRNEIALKSAPQDGCGEGQEQWALHRPERPAVAN